MPKIKNIAVGFGGERLPFEIWFSNKDKFFIKGGLPVRVKDVLKDRITEHFDSPDQLETAMRNMGKEYDEAITKRKKVIVYRLTMGKAAIEELDMWGFCGTAGTSILGYGFSVSHEIGFEYTVGEKSYIKGLSEGDLEFDMKTFHDQKVIEWTQAREDFFKSLQEATLDLCRKIGDFMGEDKEAQLRAIDSGKLLLGRGKQD